MSLQFERPTKAKIISVNPTSEIHGDKLVPAVHVRFEIDMPNGAALAAYSADLLDALYDRQVVDAQASIPDISPIATHLRFPQLGGPLRWQDATMHEALTIDYGLGADSNTVLRQVKCHKHSLALKEGGTVTVTFTASATHVGETIAGRLAVRVQHDVHVLLTEGEPYEADDDDD